jgi:hypothetical protein
VAIGAYAGNQSQFSGAIAIGQFASSNNQGTNAIAIGIEAGRFSQQTLAIAIGNQAGYTGQGQYSVAIGFEAGKYDQGFGAVAIGYGSGRFTQGIYSIAIGNNAASFGQSNNSIIMNAGTYSINQPANSIVLNATNFPVGDPFVSSSAFYVSPVREITTNANASYLMLYNNSTKEITHSQLQSNYNKTFVIDHPKDINKYLVHACLEGPESGVYYRGKGEIQNNQSTKILLPDYVDALAYEFTVQITPIYTSNKYPNFQCTEVTKNEFEVYGENGKFFWLVHAKRSEVDVEPLKSKTTVKGDGPYRWISTFHNFVKKVEQNNLDNFVKKG